MWLYYGTTQRNGTPTFKFFLSPSPLWIFPVVVSFSFFDSLRGSNLPFCSPLGLVFSGTGDGQGDITL